jgi:hypothetical protein
MPNASAAATKAVRTEVPTKRLGYTPPEAPAAAETRPATIGPSAQPTLPPTLTSPKALDRIPCGVTSATIAFRDASNIDQPMKPWAAETARYPAKPSTRENAKKLAELPTRAASITGLRPTRSISGPATRPEKAPAAAKTARPTPTSESGMPRTLWK